MTPTTVCSKSFWNFFVIAAAGAMLTARMEPAAMMAVNSRFMPLPSGWGAPRTTIDEAPAGINRQFPGVRSSAKLPPNSEVPTVLGRWRLGQTCVEGGGDTAQHSQRLPGAESSRLTLFLGSRLTEKRANGCPILPPVALSTERKTIARGFR